MGENQERRGRIYACNLLFSGGREGGLQVGPAGGCWRVCFGHCCRCLGVLDGRRLWRCLFASTILIFVGRRSNPYATFGTLRCQRKTREKGRMSCRGTCVCVLVSRFRDEWVVCVHTFFFIFIFGGHYLNPEPVLCMHACARAWIRPRVCVLRRRGPWARWSTTSNRGPERLQRELYI